MTLITLILWKRHYDLKFVMYNVRLSRRGLSTILFSPGRLKDLLVEMNLLVCVLRHWSLLAMYKVFINRVQITWKNPWGPILEITGKYSFENIFLWEYFPINEFPVKFKMFSYLYSWTVWKMISHENLKIQYVDNLDQTVSNFG
jgi:hypothetical protein